MALHVRLLFSDLADFLQNLCLVRASYYFIPKEPGDQFLRPSERLSGSGTDISSSLVQETTVRTSHVRLWTTVARDSGRLVGEVTQVDDVIILI